MTGPNFYKIDCEREVVLQGKSSYFLTITRNDSAEFGAISPTNYLCIILYPQLNTFETHINGIELANTDATTAVVVSQPTNLNPLGGFQHLGVDLSVKSYADKGLVVPATVTNLANGATSTIVTFDNPFTTAATGSTGAYALGVYSEDGGSWSINCVQATLQTKTIYENSLIVVNGYSSTVSNPFDGTVNNTPLLSPGTAGTGYVERVATTQAILIPPNTAPYSAGNDSNNLETRGITLRIDYDGVQDSHLKFNFLVAELASPTSVNIRNLVSTYTSGDYGVKSYLSTPPNPVPAANIDYQEIHFFGYPESYIRAQRDSAAIPYSFDQPLYEDKISFSLIKTNPKLSGNVKITTDTNGDIWLNSFDANEELSKSEYKRFPISTNSTYPRDLYSFFKNGLTPPEVVFDLYQLDDQYLNNKTEYAQQFDNFYNYGVTALNSKFYDEDYAFLAPLWVRKQIPDFFLILRVDHPIDPNSYYTDYNQKEAINNFFQGARIIKSFDLRDSSNLGGYVRKITNDPQFRERPLEVSWDKDNATYWNGIAYQKATMTAKGEYLYDFYHQDRPIKEFEEYITDGFQRNGIINANLLNLEFLFNDEEADLYSINRYVGLYVSENQLAEFEIEPKVLGKITNQTPAPKSGVDGEPYSLRPFTQSNPNGVELPVNYYHNNTFTLNGTNRPENPGLVVGKFPLSNMVADPLRLFYVKDRDDVFKRVIDLQEVDYGYPGTTNYLRATQLRLLDNTENISQYGGVNNIVAQTPATLLGSGNSQLRLHLLDNEGSGVLADDEELLIRVRRYNDPGRNSTYHLQITDVTPTTATVQYFLNQTVTQLSSSFVQPSVGGSVTLSVVDSSIFTVGERIYIATGGYYQITAISTTTSMDVVNVGGVQNTTPSTVIGQYAIVAQSLTGEVAYNLNPLDFLLNIDNQLTVNLLSFTTTPYVVLDAWRVEVDYPSIQKFTLLGTTTTSELDAEYKTNYEQFTWRMIASGVGLPAGDAWDYPQYDPNNLDWLSQFSNEGTPEQVAQAIALCVNSFENIPVTAWADGRVVYLKSKLQFEEGNSITFTRKLKPLSVYENLGFYEDANVDRGTQINLIDYQGAAGGNYYLTNVYPEIVDQPSSANVAGSYFIRIYRGVNVTTVYVRRYVDATTYTSASSTGVMPVTIVSVPTTEDRYFDVRIPFSLDIKQIPLETIHEQVYTISTELTVEQLFIGGVQRLRNRASIGLTEAEKYYQDRQLKKTVTLNSGSKIVSISPTGLYIGALVTGAGIPNSTIISDIRPTEIVLNNAATLTGSSEITLGSISILNDTVIYQQWYQCLKEMYRRMKGWSVQGKLIYSLPYLEEPTFDANETLSGYTDYQSKAIIQLDDPTQEFFYSPDKRIVAYSVYRPTMGVFSIYPIKTFDFDYFFSDYAYTPTLEAFKYFTEERLNPDEVVELAPFGNYRLTQSSNASFGLVVSAYDSQQGAWIEIDLLQINTLDASNSILLNTFYPFYDYDPTEYPYKTETVFVSGKQYTAPGRRNYDRRYLYNQDGAKIYPTMFRVEYKAVVSTDTLTITNANYESDQDISTFNGFAGIQDITSIGDADYMEQLKQDGQYIEAFTYQLLLSEYDRLRENYNKDWAVKSKVVPYINKWVAEGTDARDNYYRLNNSMAFGITNISPAENVDFSETALLTQEFPYLDSVPKDYPVANLESSRGYFFAKLSDIATKNKSWFTLLTTDNTNDWFTKYFSLGYPTEIDYEQNLISKPREERFTFFKYNDGVGQSQTLFRGGKLQLLSYNETLANRPLNTDNPNFDGYKFSAITRFEPFEPSTEQKPINIQVIRNETWKWVVLVITVRIQDYRTQTGGGEFMLQYFMNDILGNQKQNQYALNLSAPINASTALRNFYPYGAKPSSGLNDYLDAAVLRPRQGLLGGGYLHLGDKKLGGIAADIPSVSPSYIPSLVKPQLNFSFINIIDDRYNFNVLEEIYPIQNNYRIAPNLYTIDTNYVKTVAKNYGRDGFTFNFLTVYKNTSPLSYALRSSVDNQNRNNVFSTSNLTIGAGLYYNRITASFTPLLNPTFNGTNSPSIQIALTDGNINLPEVETYHLEGGTLGFQSIKFYLTYGNLFQLFNANDPIVEYFDVTDTGLIQYNAGVNNYQLKFIAPDTIIKENVLHFALDEDKPDEFKTTDIVGYDIVNTRGREYLVRHRGSYEPKTRDVLSFWLREDDSMSTHFELDFLLKNTRIDNLSQSAGQIKNYGINKVATLGNIMQIARTSAFQSVYPLVGEIAVDASDYFVFGSTWDGKFYRNYTTTTQFTNQDGVREMKEYKTFLASKAMNVPKSFELHTFDSDEVTFTVVQPSVSIGVDTLTNNSSATQQSKPDANRPKLNIRLNLRARLLRQLLNDLDAIPNNEFMRLLTVTTNTNLSALSLAEIEELKVSYFTKNILPLYEVTAVTLYAKNQKGLPILNLNITELDKNRAGYKIDKNCQLTTISDFEYEITKILDPKVDTGFALAATLKRI